MISVDEALARCFALVSPLATETVPLRHAAGRVMAQPAIARRDQPPFAASAMDGYALQGDPAPGDRFTLIGEAGAGHAFHGSIGPGQTVRIFTGAPIPDGATRVVAVDISYRPDSAPVSSMVDSVFQTMHILVKSLIAEQARFADVAIRLDLHRLMQDVAQYEHVLLEAGQAATRLAWPQIVVSSRSS